MIILSLRDPHNSIYIEQVHMEKPLNMENQGQWTNHTTLLQIVYDMLILFKNIGV